MPTPKLPPSSVHIAPAQASDLPALMNIRVPAFASIPLEHTLHGANTPTTRTALAQRHLTAWSEHTARHPSSPSCPIKAVYTDPTNASTVVGFAEWFFYAAQTEQQVLTPHYHADPATLAEDKREVAAQWLNPVHDARVKYLGRKPYGVLMYMCVAEEWRRKGVSTMCVQWGMRECERRGCVGYLEASEEGLKVYEKLGWKKVGDVVCGKEGEEMRFPAMVYVFKGVDLDVPGQGEAEGEGEELEGLREEDRSGSRKSAQE